MEFIAVEWDDPAKLVYTVFIAIHIFASKALIVMFCVHVASGDDVISINAKCYVSLPNCAQRCVCVFEVLIWKICGDNHTTFVCSIVPNHLSANCYLNAERRPEKTKPLNRSANNTDRHKHTIGVSDKTKAK